MKHKHSEEPKKAAHVDADAKQRNIVRLKRIEGQVRGLQKMVEEERWCPDILAQVAAVEQALRAVSKELVRNHLRHCAHKALAGTHEEQAQFVDEIADVLLR